MSKRSQATQDLDEWIKNWKCRYRKALLRYLADLVVFDYLFGCYVDLLKAKVEAV